MHKLTFRLLAIASIVLFATSCNKLEKFGDHQHGPHEQEATKYITIDKLLSYGETYTLDLSAYEDADDLSAIATQALKFTTSELTGLASTKNNTYTYLLNRSDLSNTQTVVTPDSTTQQVVINVTEGPHLGNSGHTCGNGGNNENKLEAVITLNFTIK